MYLLCFNVAYWGGVISSSCTVVTTTRWPKLNGANASYCDLWHINHTLTQDRHRPVCNTCFRQNVTHCYKMPHFVFSVLTSHIFHTYTCMFADTRKIERNYNTHQQTCSHCQALYIARIKMAVMNNISPHHCCSAFAYYQVMWSYC